ncbi:hypothetical protein GCWU000325_01669 [Alloprevotella tannerae ATCC 51259]|uniref:Uncharacterized protein n=1 Tax=Alloprevotella tannerae ATCC 51259 TaxID=626522 RepID=C9LHK4_9BACT|nr:hypothetical protein GCWU000325_01669 [Alloprevotella tannerae ATCC 51259]
MSCVTRNYFGNSKPLLLAEGGTPPKSVFLDGSFRCFDWLFYRERSLMDFNCV